MSRLTTATDVIALGGTIAVARLLNVGASPYQIIVDWASTRYYNSLACAQKGLDAQRPYLVATIT